MLFDIKLEVVPIRGIEAWLRSNGIGKGAAIFILAFLIISAGLIGNLIYNSVQNNYTLNNEEVTIHLPNSIKVQKEVTAYNAGFDLEAQGIMKANTFRYLVEKGTGRDIFNLNIKSGYYTIPPKTHYKDLLKILGIMLKN